MDFLRLFKKYWSSGALRKQAKRAPEPPGGSNAEKLDQRAFSRHWVSFPVIVSWAGDFQSGESREKTVLQDISGGGALFVSKNPGNYYPGQLLSIAIMLDGTHEVRARIMTEATVVRISHDIKPDPHSPDPKTARIAVQFDRSFEFERIDNHDRGSLG